MSRIGKRILEIPSGLSISYDNDTILIKNAKDSLKVHAPKEHFEIKINDNKFSVFAKDELKQTQMMHGTINALVHNAILGLTKGCMKQLKIVGVGYKVSVAGDKLTLNLGYSKPVIMQIPQGIKVEAKIPTELTISGFDKEEVGQFAAEVRSKRPPEPYKGKGVMYADEIIQRKVGKTAEGSKGK
ncbi:50S ribosomal protein L6 [bacterium]|nr:50S ribosomal protein L6 [bacterium]